MSCGKCEVCSCGIKEEIFEAIANKIGQIVGELANEMTGQEFVDTFCTHKNGIPKNQEV